MLSAKIISDNFSRGMEAYDKSASCQRHVAEKLAGLIGRHEKVPAKILELGCGTGFLTEKLFRSLPDCDFTITDLSEKMLSRCIEKTSGIHVRKKTFALCDFDKPIPAGGFDVVVSSMSFQWSDDLGALASSARALLNPGGMIFFSMLVEPTFEMLRKTFSELETRYPAPEFKTEAEVRSIFSAFSGKHFQTETFKERYKDTSSFLKHLNCIGAGNPTGRSINAGRLRKIIEKHDSKYSSNGFIEAEYRILYGALKK